MKGVDKMKSALQADVERVVRQYTQTLYKICLVLLCNNYDAEDAVQETFFKYIHKSPVFNELEHEKAWLISVATNTCRNMRRFKFMHLHENIDDLYDYVEKGEDKALLETLMTLPTKYKEVLLLHYVEGYKVNEIAGIITISVAAVKKRLQKGRKLLKDKYMKEVQ